jgi:hypothetical protein
MKTKVVFSMLAILLLLSVTTAVAAPNANDKPVIQTVMKSDLSLKSVLSTEFSKPAPQLAGSPSLFKYCACSCGYRCSTDADCGPGGSCITGITCCARDPKTNKLNAIFAQKDANSSHKNGSAVAVSVNCKR